MPSTLDDINQNSEDAPWTIDTAPVNLWLRGIAGSGGSRGDFQATITAYSHPTNYAVVVQNPDTTGGTGGRGFQVLGSDSVNRLSVQDAGVTAAGLSAGATTLTSLHVTGNSLLDGTLGAGATTVTTLHATGAATLDSTLGAGATTVTDLTATGNAALGNANADTLTVIAVSTFRNAAAAVQLFIDPANARVIIGSSTALGAATNDMFTVAGGTAYFAGPSGSAIGIRYNAAQTVGWLVGVDGAGANKDLLFLDDGGAEVVRIGDTSSTYQLRVTSDFNVTDDAVIGGDLTVGAAALFNGSSFHVTSASTFDGALTVTTGGAALTGTVAVTGAFSASLSSAFNAGLSIAGGLSVTTGTVDFATAATSASGTAASAAGALVLAFGSGGLGLYVSTGAPTVTAPVGSLCASTGGSGVANRLYVSKGAGNWASVSTTS